MVKVYPYVTDDDVACGIVREVLTDAAPWGSLGQGQRAARYILVSLLTEERAGVTHGNNQGDPVSIVALGSRIRQCVDMVAPGTYDGERRVEVKNSDASIAHFYFPSTSQLSVVGLTDAEFMTIAGMASLGQNCGQLASVLIGGSWGIPGFYCELSRAATLLSAARMGIGCLPYEVRLAGMEGE